MKIRKSYLFAVGLALMAFLTGCSGDNSVIQDPGMQEIEIQEDTKGYYYHGFVHLSKTETGEDVYRINRPLMYPMHYGHTIPIPVPDYESTITVKMGEGTVIDSNSVIIQIGGREERFDMPSEGTREYCRGLSITRLATDAYEVAINPHLYQSQSGYDDVKIMMRPVPYMAFDDYAEGGGQYLKFESAADFDLPAEIPLHLRPYTFTDRYRPIIQYDMTVY